jgi:hypothetical protein
MYRRPESVALVLRDLLRVNPEEGAAFQYGATMRLPFIGHAFPLARLLSLIELIPGDHATPSSLCLVQSNIEQS